MKKTNKPSFGYRLFSLYVRAFHDRIYYRKTYALDTQNVPAPGTSVLIATNHQNGANDMLGFATTFHDRKANFIARADAFTILPAANVVLRAIGLLPAYRIGWEGAEALSNNADSFEISEHTLLNGGTVVICPEGGHQDCHYLGPFSYGYTRMAFQAAEKGNFEREIFILPACNHYDRYNGLRNQVLVRYGTPISIAPYYELYKTRPRTAQRQVCKLVRAQIHDLMLCVDDIENYDSIDYLRTSEYGDRYAAKAGIDPRRLPDRMATDKKFVATLDEAKEKDCGFVQGLYDDVSRLLEGMRSIRATDRQLRRTPNALLMFLQFIAAVALLPLGLFCLWPGIIIYGVGHYLSFVRMKDKMMEGTFILCLGILVFIPILGIPTIILAGVFAPWWSGLVWLFFLPAICWFAWTYWAGVTKLFRDARFLFRNGKKVRELRKLRREIFDKADKIFDQKSFT